MPARKGQKFQKRIPADLIDARWVAANPQGETKSPMRRGLQTLFVDDFKGFLARKDRLEAQHAARLAGGVESEPSVVNVDNTVPPDAGSERVEALIERLLGEVGQP